MAAPRMTAIANNMMLKSNLKDKHYRLFTEEGWHKILEEKRVRKLKEIEKHRRVDEGKLVDGELKFDTDDINEDLHPDPDLLAGSVLSEERFGTFPMDLIGKPLEEIDQNLKDKSFVVINTRFKIKYIYRYTATKSFFLCTPWNCIRKMALLISTNQIFDYFIMLTILVNCAFLALNNDYPISEYIFLAIYTLEMVIRMTARGLIINSYTYLRDPYNLVDILIIILSYIMIIIEKCYGQNNVNVSSLRTLRVLRALKTITILPGLKTITSALIKSLKMLFEVIILSLFCMSFFALFALQIYQGTLRNKCVMAINWKIVNSSNITDVNAYYYNWTNNASNWITNGINYLTCGNQSGAGNCSKAHPNAICLPNIGQNPNFGYTNFDNFGWALLSVFQLITLDYWENQYNFVIRSSGSWNILFYIIVVFFGSFYLINLMLAVVSMSYEEEAEAQNRENEREKIRKNKKCKKNKKSKKKTKISPEKYNKIGEEMSKLENSVNGNGCNDILGGEECVVNAEVKRSDSNDNLRFMDSEEENETVNEEGEEDFDDELEVERMTKDSAAEGSKQLMDHNCLCCVRQNVIYKKWVMFQNRLYIFVTDPFFDLFISFCIFINTIIMACEHYPSEAVWDQILKYSNIIFTVIYIMECFLKIMAMSKEYFKVGWNIFDFVVVIASIIDLGVEEVDALSIFRAFRLFRVFKLAQSWQTMRLLLTIIFSTITEMGNLSIIVLLVLYMFAVIGKQSYRNTYLSNTFGEKLPRWNFDDFWHSMILVFRVICGEWIEPSFDCIRANGYFCLLIFIPTLVLGNFVVLNLFLALLLNSFASDTLKNTTDEEFSKFKIVMDRLKRIGLFSKAKIMNGDMEDNSGEGMNANIVKTSTIEILDLENNIESNQTTVEKRDSMRLHEIKDDNLVSFDHVEDSTHSNRFIADGNGTTSDNKQITFNMKTVEKSSERSLSNNQNDKNYEEEEENVVELKDCCCAFCYNPFQEKKPCHCCYCITCDKESSSGSRWYNFRNKTLSITEHKAFEGVVLVCILASSLCLCFEDIYLDNNPTLKHALKIVNYVFTSLFCIEMVLKIISLGFKIYFTSFWTILDFCIVSISFLSLLNDLLGFGTEITAFRSLRTMRALRPLRAISRWQGMKIVVNALIYAIPSIFNVLLVCLVFWLIFSITGVQFFKGKFFKCMDRSSGERLSSTIVPNRSECLRQNYTWINSNINFDNATNGFLALYQIATFEGWMEIMQDAVDSTEVNSQPRPENHMAYYVYFIIFILVGSFFILNLFIGVIIDNFNRLKNKYEGNYIDVFLTASQRNYYNTMKKLSNRKPRKTVRRPKALLQGFFYDVAMSNRFELVIVVLIFLNMMVMMVEHYKQSATFTNVLDMINIMFSTIFTLEAVVKISGLRWHYFRIMWNIFDFIIVLLSILDLIVNLFRSFSDLDLFSEDSLKVVTPTLLRVVRIFRIGRVLRLIKVAKGIRKLLFALVISLPALFNIGALLLLIVFIYAIVGMSVFGNLKKTGGLDDLVNFETFERSMLLLFRLTTAGGWNDVLEAMFVQPPYCNNTFVIRDSTPKPVSNGDCGVAWFGILYMTTFIFICYLIIINMYIAIILENFNQAHDQEEVGITEDDFEMFYLVWERYDPHASQYIKYEYLSDFVAELDEPLGIPKPNMIALVSFDLPIVEGDKMHCLDILIALVKHVIGDVEDSEEFRKIKRQMEVKYEEVFPTRVHTNIITTTMERKKQDIAAKTLQRAWKHQKAQKAFKLMSENATLSSRHDAHYFQSNKQSSAGTAGQIFESSASVQSYLRIPQFSRST